MTKLAIVHRKELSFHNSRRISLPAYQNESNRLRPILGDFAYPAGVIECFMSSNYRAIGPCTQVPVTAVKPEVPLTRPPQEVLKRTFSFTDFLRRSIESHRCGQKLLDYDFLIKLYEKYTREVRRRGSQLDDIDQQNLKNLKSWYIETVAPPSKQPSLCELYQHSLLQGRQAGRMWKSGEATAPPRLGIGRKRNLAMDSPMSSAKGSRNADGKQSLDPLKSPPNLTNATTSPMSSAKGSRNVDGKQSSHLLKSPHNLINTTTPGQNARLNAATKNTNVTFADIKATATSTTNKPTKIESSTAPSTPNESNTKTFNTNTTKTTNGRKSKAESLRRSLGEKSKRKARQSKAENGIDEEHKSLRGSADKKKKQLAEAKGEGALEAPASPTKLAGSKTEVNQSSNAFSSPSAILHATKQNLFDISRQPSTTSKGKNLATSEEFYPKDLKGFKDIVMPVLYHEPFDARKPWTWIKRYPSQYRPAPYTYVRGQIEPYIKGGVDFNSQNPKTQVAIAKMFGYHYQLPLDCGNKYNPDQKADRVSHVKISYGYPVRKPVKSRMLTRAELPKFALKHYNKIAPLRPRTLMQVIYGHQPYVGVSKSVLGSKK